MRWEEHEDEHEDEEEEADTDVVEEDERTRRTRARRKKRRRRRRRWRRLNVGDEGRCATNKSMLLSATAKTLCVSAQQHAHIPPPAALTAEAPAAGEGADAEGADAVSHGRQLKKKEEAAAAAVH